MAQQLGVGVGSGMLMMMARRWIGAGGMWVAVVMVLMIVVGVESGSSFPKRLDMFHKFSSKAKQVMHSRYGEEVTADWPAEGTIEFQTMLRDHDVARHGQTLSRRILAAAQKEYVFAQGNETEQLFGGGLHYAYINIGTPSQSFLVVLDTGSDLLWIPCECKSCAPLSAPSQDPRTSTLSAYAPSLSSTAKPVLCTDPLCELAAQCTDQCPYMINYVSANTSTSGTLYEDLMYFVPEQGGGPVTLPIYLGCGQMQTGSLLKGAAPDGLMGLGLTAISVPSKLAATGAMPDSFTMCISPDGSGIITFGDKGPVGQTTTAIVPFAQSNLETYIAEISTVTVGKTAIPMASQALFDTGTSFTYLSKTVYPSFVQAYQQQMTLPQYAFNNWDLCFQTSDTNFQVPLITLSFPEGGTLTVVSGLKSIVDTENEMVAVCVTVMDSGADLSIIGQNFMTNYSIAYDRGDMLLGWIESDCSKDLTPPTATTPVATPAATPTTVSPASSPTTSPALSPPSLSPSTLFPALAPTVGPPVSSPPSPPTTIPTSSSASPTQSVVNSTNSPNFPFGAASTFNPTTILSLLFPALSLLMTLFSQ